MGNRTYILRTSKENSIELFEADNTLPLFWQCLLDINAIESIEPEIIRVFAMGDEDVQTYLEKNPSGVTVKLPKQVFLNNAKDGRPFIERYLENDVIVFDDFMRYLDKKYGEEDILELSIFEMGNFEGMAKYINNLKKNLTAIKQENYIPKLFPMTGTIFELTGYDRYLGNGFAGYSERYADACRKEEDERKKRQSLLDEQERKRSIKNKIESVFIIFLGMVFLLASVFFITKEGLSVLLVCGILFGVVSAVYGVIKLGNNKSK
ncbi:hypothetical protein [Breznakiella homolactica]|uniref:Uncharacterized protein n=1 Tax=Breznakiella homolactica TaxID=2798577 RepID=A0A7T8BBJ2_9SPIR|nr:hypothetical protein [Breznakiella homolactica]QQO10461.1 hypothetical protein JFL75_05980 [Breznakiella homolactica]